MAKERGGWQTFGEKAIYDSRWVRLGLVDVEAPNGERWERLTPESIGVRILVPDTTAPMTFPCQVEGLADSPEFRARATEIMRRNTLAIVDNLTELGDLGLVKEVSAEVRIHRTAPLFKLYLINNAEAFFGFYPVREHIITLGGTPRAIYDIMGKDTILFHHSITDDTSTGSQYVEQARSWYDSVWNTIAMEFTR